MNFMNEFQHQLKQSMAAITSNALFRFIYEKVVRNIKPLNIIMEKNLYRNLLLSIIYEEIHLIRLVWFDFKPNRPFFELNFFKEFKRLEY